jgi:hypothetical protein
MIFHEREDIQFMASLPLLDEKPVSFPGWSGRNYVSIRRAKWSIVIFCVGLLIFAVFALRYFPQRGVERQLEAIRAEGLPASPQELDAWYKPVQDEENQALLIVDAGKSRVEAAKDADPLSGQLGSLDAGQSLSPEMEEAITDFLAANEPALALLDKAALLPASRYPIDLSLGANTLLPHLAQVKGLTQLLRVQIGQQSHLGKTNEAVRSLNTAFTLAASLKDEPLLISDLVRIACVAITMNALDRVLSEHQLNAEQLTLLSAKLAEAEATGRLALERALVGERAGSISVFNMSFAELDRLGAMSSPPSGDFGKEALRAVGYQAYRASGLRERDLSLYLETMDEYVKACKNEFPGALQEFEKAVSAQSERFSRGFAQFAVYSRMLIPALSRAALKEANLTARLRSAELALAVEHFRLDHDGSLPESLEQLAPKYLSKVPADPFDGAPLAFERLSDKGYRVTSQAATARRRAERSGGSKILPGSQDIGTSVMR